MANAKVDLYWMPASAPCRSVAMTPKELGITLNTKMVNLMEKEHLKPEFLAINPCHTVPTIVDHGTGVTLWESRAIITYLVNQYAPGHSLYPSDAKTRAVVDRFLYYDIGTVYPAIAASVYSVFQGIPVDEEKVKALKEKLTHLNEVLSKQKYVAGDNYTLADLSIYADLGNLELIDRANVLDEVQHVGRWYKQMKETLPYNKEVNEGPINTTKEIMKAKK